MRTLPLEDLSAGSPPFPAIRTFLTYFLTRDLKQFGGDGPPPRSTQSPLDRLRVSLRANQR
jgi:hypothetical protein